MRSLIADVELCVLSFAEMLDPLRVRAFEALDRVENFSTRDVGLSELKRIILDLVNDKNCKAFLGILFAPRNKRILPKLLPLLLDTAQVVAVPIITDEAQHLLLNILQDPIHHDLVGRVWTELVKAGKLSATASAKLLVSVKSEIQRQGLAAIFLSTVSFFVNCELDTRSLAEELKTIYLQGDYIAFLTELFLQLSLLIPLNEATFSDCMPDLVEDCLDVLNGNLRKIKLSRPLALSCCLLLGVISKTSGSLPEPEISAVAIVNALSRQNLRLFALTRCNPKLREAIRSAESSWRNLIRDTDPRRESRFAACISPDRYSHSPVDQILELARTSPPPSPVKWMQPIDQSTVFDAPTKPTESSVIPIRSQEAEVDDPVDRLHEILDGGDERQLLEYVACQRPEDVFIHFDRDDAQFLTHVLCELLSVDDFAIIDTRAILDWLGSPHCSLDHVDHGRLRTVLDGLCNGSLRGEAVTVLNKLHQT